MYVRRVSVIKRQIIDKLIERNNNWKFPREYRVAHFSKSPESFLEFIIDEKIITLCGFSYFSL